MKILIVKLGATGDVVRTTTLLHVLKGEIHWLTTKENAIMLNGNSFIDRCITWEESNLLIDDKFNLVINLEDTHEVAKLLQDINYDEPVDLVGISLYTSNAIRAYEIAEEFKKRNIKIVMGGIHATCLPDEASLYADAIVLGEAEDSWPRLIRDFENK